MKSYSIVATFLNAKAVDADCEFRLWKKAITTAR